MKNTKRNLLIFTTSLVALGLAALPVAGVFAASSGGPFTDTLSVTISNACTFARGSTAHAKGTTGGTSATDTGTWSDDTLSGTIAAGTAWSDFGTSNFNVVCNNAEGWKVTASSTTSFELVGGTTTSEKIGLGTVGDDTAAWSYTPSTSDSDVTAGTANGAKASTPDYVVAQSTKTTTASGRDFSVKYGVSVNHTLSDQSYTGTITYTFAQLDSSPAQTNNQSNDQTQQNNDQTQQDQNNPAPEPEQTKSAPTPKLAQSAPKQTSSTSGGTTTNTTTNTTTTNNNDTTTTEPNAEEENANALGVETSSISTTETPVENQSNTGLIVAAMIVGVAAVSGGTALYIKNRKDEA